VAAPHLDRWVVAPAVAGDVPGAEDLGLDPLFAEVVCVEDPRRPLEPRVREERLHRMVRG
jgi:hypothetical protein